MPDVLALYFLVLSMMTRLSPTDAPIFRHGFLAMGITNALLAEEPLYANDANRRRTASLVVAVAFRESSLVHNARGDCDKRDERGACVTPAKSFCAMQIHFPNGGGEYLLDDPELCVRTGIRMLRQSIRADRAYPVAFYARGPRGLEGGAVRVEAQKISNDRVALAASIVSVP